MSTALDGRRVAVYWNLHKACFSVVAVGGEAAGRVIAHVDALELTDATFAVAPAGRDKVRATGAKNVHARIRGTVAPHDADCPVPVTYDPYRHDTFVRRDTQDPVHAAAAVTLRRDGTRPVVTATLT